MDTHTRDRFYDRAGRTISTARWAQLRGNPAYTLIGDWSDGNGSAVRTVWTGIDLMCGCSESSMFETHCIVGDTATFYANSTDAAARECHDDCVSLISGTNTAPAAPPATDALIALPLTFLDRGGAPIALAQWARLRRDQNYRVIGVWRGEGGAHVTAFWTGFDLVSGFHARPQVFGVCVSAFENCPQSDSTYRFFTEKRAMDHFDRIIPLVERGVRPWDDEDVAAAGFEPLTLRAR